jgi:hypothetical protein
MLSTLMSLRASKGVQYNAERIVLVLSHTNLKHRCAHYKGLDSHVAIYVNEPQQNEAVAAVALPRANSSVNGTSSNA